MSGSTIGGVVGAVIGAYFGNPQLGWMIGSAVGGYVDPDVIKGQRLTDAQQQTSAEGVPRSIIYGTAVVAGNVIHTGPLVETKTKERTGKGGPVQETYHYSRSYAIRVCEGPVTGISRIWRDDKLVYDMRDPAQWTAAAADIETLASDTARFASIVTIYLGDESQSPDPTLEGISGMGNVCAYRGTCYVVFTNDDLTDRQGTIPQYRFEVISHGTVATTTVSEYVAPSYSRFINADYPLANADTDYTFAEGSGEDAAGSYSALGASIAACQAAAAGHYAGWGSPTAYVGCLAGAGPYSTGAGHMEGHGATTDLTNLQEVWLLYSWVAPTSYHSDVRLRGGNGVGDVSAPATGGAWEGDALGCVYRSYTSHDATLSSFPYTTEGFKPLAIRLQTKQLAPADGPATGETLLPDHPGYVVNADGVVRQLATYTLVSGSFRTLALESVTGVTYDQRELGPVLAVGDASDTSAYWTAAYNAAVTAGTMPAGMTYSATGTGGSTTYPRNKSSAYAKSMTTSAITIDDTVLSAIVADLCARVDVTASSIDVASLTDVVRGFVVGRQLPASDAIRTLQQGYFFDFPEWGNWPDTGTKLRAIRRGGATVFDLTGADLVQSDEDQDTRAQAVEFPRKINLITSDVDSDYAPTKQTAERRTDNVKAVGEVTLELPLALTRVEAAPIADKMLKVAWEEALGKWERQLPEEYSALVPSDCFTHDGKRWRAEKCEYGDGIVKVEATRDRVQAYTSVATPSSAPPPTGPVSSTRGPTVAAFMNLPSLRTADSTPGMYVAVCGLLDGWIGCDLQLSVDGGLTYQSVAVITTESTMGSLTANVTASGSPLSTTVLHSHELDSVTTAQLAARFNAAAIISGGVSEIAQFQTATETLTAGTYDLTDLTRGELGTTAASHSIGDRFVLLDQVTFLPLDVSLAGQTLLFRPVSIGTAAANNATYSVVFDPQFTSAPVLDFYTDDAGNTYTDQSGTYYEQAT